MSKDDNDNNKGRPVVNVKVVAAHKRGKKNNFATEFCHWSVHMTLLPRNILICSPTRYHYNRH